jgi:uncharacterized membrane protein YfcA
VIAVLSGTGAIGVSIGLVGIGGVFLIPLLVWSGLPLETAIGTSLVTFTVTGVIATVIYAQGGAVDWRATLLTSAGSLVSGTLGAKLSTVLPGRIVTSAPFRLSSDRGARRMRESRRICLVPSHSSGAGSLPVSGPA